jgi:hypothetical protein
MKNSELLLNTGMSERGAWEGVAEEQNAQLTTTTTAATGVATTGFRPLPVAAQMTMSNTQGPASNSTLWRVPPKKTNETTQLAALVRERLAEMGVRQSEFCRLYRFDQGLLSKIQNSVITNLSLECVLRLSVGLSVPPQKILALIDRPDLHDLVLQAYGQELEQRNIGTA